MSLKIDRLQLEIVINNDQARKSLRVLEDESRILTKEMKKLDQTTAEWAQKNDRLKAIKIQMDKIYDSIGLTNLSLKELKNRQNEVNLILSRMSPSMQGYKELKAQADAISLRLRELKGNANNTGISIGKIADGFNKYFAMATAGIAAFTGVFISIKGMIQGNAELSDAFADVAKTSGLAVTEVKELYKELGKIDTRTSRKDLLDLAYAAGKLGYTGKSEILGFVKAADQIGVALSKDLGGDVEKAVTDLGKLTDIFKIKEEFGIEKALLKTGSAINALGASGTANEAYIVEFTKRVGGIAPQAGMTIEKVLGLAATLDQLGQQTETSSTAITQLLSKMFAKPAEFAKIAGVSVAEFTKLLKKDANEALILLLEGLQKNKGGLTELATKFSDLGVDGSRSISVIGALAGNVDMLRQSQQLSNKEFGKGTSLTQEFNLKNENMAGNLERIGKALRAAFVNTSVMTGLEKIVGWIASWYDIPLDEKLEKERNQVNLLASQLMEANVPATQRNKLYNELKGIAPDIVEGINAESIAYDKLRQNLEKYNQQMINKIVLARKDKEIEEMANDAADWVAKRTEAEQKIREFMTRSATHLKTKTKEAETELKAIVDNELLTFQQKYDAFWKSIEKSLAKGGNIGPVQILSLDKDKISTTYTMYLNYLKQEKAAIGEVNNVTDDRNELAKSLGISLGITANKTNEAAGAIKKEADGYIPYSGNVDKAKTAMEKLNEAIAKKQALLEQQIQNGDKGAEATAKELAKLIAEKGHIESVIEAYKKLFLTRTGVDPMQKMKSIGAPVLTGTGETGTLPSTNKQTEAELKQASDKWYAEEAYKVQEDLENRKHDLQVSAIETSKQLLTMWANYQYDHEMSLMNAKYDKEEQRLKKLLDAKTITQEEYDAKVADLNIKRHKKEVDLARKQARREQEIATLAIGVNLAKTLFEIQAKAAAFTAGVVTAPLAAVALAQIPWVVGAAALETGLVWAKPMPQYAAGGPTGPGYSIPDQTGQRPAGYVHENEYVIPAWERKIPAVMHMESIIEAIRTRGYAAGGAVSSTATSTKVMQPLDAVTIKTMNRFCDTMDNIAQNGFEAFVDYQKLQKFNKKVDNTEKGTAL